jgi:hypothetical protein
MTVSSRDARAAWLAGVAAGTALFLCAALPGAAATAAETFAAPVVVGGPPAGFDTSAEPWAHGLVLQALTGVSTHAPSRHPTVARLVFDKANLYVAVHAAQAGVPITATQSTNEVGFGLDDFVGVGIDTSGNGSRVYYFEVTPAGVRYQQSSESSRYSPAWRAAARVMGGDWDAQLVIPLDVLRGAAGGVWRFNLIRHVAALNDNESWAYGPAMDAGTGAWPVFEDARFWPALRDVPGRVALPKPRAELYGLAGAGPQREQYRLGAGSFGRQSARNAGLDVNLPLTKSMSFVGTVAPDFSNVETDQQTIAPQEFRLNLQETRPFFAQGAEYFDPVAKFSVVGAPDRLLYTPGIGPFDRGEKIEGTYGLQSLGILDVKGAGFADEAFGFTHRLPGRTFGYSVDVVSAHHDDGNATASPGAGQDTTYKLAVAGRDPASGFQYAANYGGESGSVPGTTPRLAYTGTGYVDVKQANYEAYLGWEAIGPKWNPIDGFTNIADVRGPQAYVDLSTSPRRGAVKRAELFVFGDRLLDGSGAVHEADASASIDLMFRNQFHLSGGPSVSSLRFYGDGASLVGYDLGYAGGVTVPFNSHSIGLGYKDGTPVASDLTVSFGPFTTFRGDGSLRRTFVRQYDLSLARPLGPRWSAAFEYAGTLESDDAEAFRDGQTLRRLSLVGSLSRDQNVSVALRSISGRGGFALPGVDLSASFHRRFARDSELFLEYGAPSARTTLQRWLLKYVLRVGGAAGV